MRAEPSRAGLQDSAMRQHVRFHSGSSAGTNAQRRGSTNRQTCKTTRSQRHLDIQKPIRLGLSVARSVRRRHLSGRLRIPPPPPGCPNSDIAWLSDLAPSDGLRLGARAAAWWRPHKTLSKAPRVPLLRASLAASNSATSRMHCEACGLYQVASPCPATLLKPKSRSFFGCRSARSGG